MGMGISSGFKGGNYFKKPKSQDGTRERLKPRISPSGDITLPSGTQNDKTAEQMNKCKDEFYGSKVNKTVVEIKRDMLKMSADIKQKFVEIKSGTNVDQNKEFLKENLATYYAFAKVVKELDLVTDDLKRDSHYDLAAVKDALANERPIELNIEQTGGSTKRTDSSETKKEGLFAKMG